MIWRKSKEELLSNPKDKKIFDLLEEEGWEVTIDGDALNTRGYEVVAKRGNCTISLYNGEYSKFWADSWFEFCPSSQIDIKRIGSFVFLTGFSVDVSKSMGMVEDFKKVTKHTKKVNLINKGLNFIKRFVSVK